MARGKAKSLEEHMAAGTFRADRHAHLLPPGGLAAAVDGAADPLVRPAGLSDAEAAKWDKIVGTLGAAVTARDETQMVELVRWACRADQLAETLAGLSPEEKGYPKTLVSAAIIADKLTKLAGGFGMSPADRAKLRQVAAPPTRAKVATRQPTAMDMSGPPTGGR